MGQIWTILQTYFSHHSLKDNKYTVRNGIPNIALNIALSIFSLTIFRIPILIMHKIMYTGIPVFVYVYTGKTGGWWGVRLRRRQRVSVQMTTVWRSSTVPLRQNWNTTTTPPVWTCCSSRTVCFHPPSRWGCWRRHRMTHTKLPVDLEAPEEKRTSRSVSSSERDWSRPGNITIFETSLQKYKYGCLGMNTHHPAPQNIFRSSQEV
jgi:hypothetical protein